MERNNKTNPHSPKSHKILDHPSVFKQMDGQWNMKYGYESADSQERDRTWRLILRQIKPYKSKKVLVLKYAAIAAAICLFFFGALIYQTRFSEPRYINMVSTGKLDFKKLRLDDGTEVKLGANSELIYPKKFTSQKRELVLDGYAFFNVAKDASRPFTVRVKDVAITALGTSFEIFYDKKRDLLETTLLTGRVRVARQRSESAEEAVYTMEPNERLTIDFKSGKFSVQKKNADRYISWRNYDGLSFENEQFVNIIPRLETWYGIRISVQSAKLLQERFTFKVKNETFADVLHLIQQTTSIQYKYDQANQSVLISPSNVIPLNQ
jgi:ferric-dicitrate binding protein FerR (iron transport regulator)